MDGQEEWAVFNVVEVQTVEARSERKCSNQSTLVCKQRSVNRINSLRVL